MQLLSITSKSDLVHKCFTSQAWWLHQKYQKYLFINILVGKCPTFHLLGGQLSGGQLSGGQLSGGQLSYTP